MVYRDNQQIIKELNKVISDKGLTKAMIAQKMGMIPQTLTKLLAKKNFSFEDLNKILNTMELRLEIRFIEGEEMRYNVLEENIKDIEDHFEVKELEEFSYLAGKILRTFVEKEKGKYFRMSDFNKYTNMDVVKIKDAIIYYFRRSKIDIKGNFATVISKTIIYKEKNDEKINEKAFILGTMSESFL